MHPLGHAATVVATCGSTYLAERFLGWARNQVADDVDELARASSKVLAGMWDDIRAVAGDMTSVIYLFGFSGSKRRYVGYGLSGAAPGRLAWKPIDVCMHGHVDFDRPPPTSKFFVSPNDGTLDGLAAPTTADGWADLAQLVRHDQITKPPDRRYPIAGTVIYTLMTEEGAVVQVPIRRFDDTGEEFRALMAGTAHPLAATP